MEDVFLSALITSFATNLCIYSNCLSLGYTLISQDITLQIYGISTLSLLGINPPWIVCYDLMTNAWNKTYCKVAHAVKFEFIEKHVN